MDAQHEARGTVHRRGATDGPAGSGEPTGDPMLLGGARILVAEDTAMIRRLVSMFLTKGGARVEVVRDGQEAVECALAAEASPDPFDLVLMDMQMPVMDGYQAATALRAAGYRKPIVALTAHAGEEDARACCRAGCDGHLAKPIGCEAMIAACARWIGRPHAGA